MICFPCLPSHEKVSRRSNSTRKEQLPAAPPPPPRQSTASPPAAFSANHHKGRPTSEATRHNNNNQNDNHHKRDRNVPKDSASKNIAAQTFTFRELAVATKNFRQECLIGEGGFGRVYKARLEKTGQVAAIKQLDRNGVQGNREFVVEVLMLSLLHHENLVNLIGYCADGDQRLVVYEYMPRGSVEEHLLDLVPNQKPLDWFTRMKIALGAAKGLEYLHDRANPPVIYRDLKSSNILLDPDFNAKLSDFGLAKLGPMGDKTHVSSRVMGTYGYCAPEYQRTGQLTVKSDVYSFGVVMLELITGKRAIDTTRPTQEQNLVTWALPIAKDPHRHPQLADPLLGSDYPPRGLNQAVAVAAMCLNEEPSARPLMSDVVTALSFLWLGPGMANSSVPANSLPSGQNHGAAGRAGKGSNDDHWQAVAEAVEPGSNSGQNNLG